MNEQINLTLRNIIISLGNISVGDNVIVDSRAVWCCRKISVSSANGEHNISKPFERADGEPLNVTERDREGENVSFFIGQGQIYVDHLEVVNRGGSYISTPIDRLQRLTPARRLSCTVPGHVPFRPGRFTATDDQPGMMSKGEFKVHSNTSKYSIWYKQVQVHAAVNHATWIICDDSRRLLAQEESYAGGRTGPASTSRIGAEPNAMFSSSSTHGVDAGASLKLPRAGNNGLA
jgi:hypothetical protein